MGISATGMVTSRASPIRQSMANMAIATTRGSRMLELSSGIMWARGGSMSSIRSTMVLFMAPIGRESTSPRDAPISRSAAWRRKPSRMV